MINSARLLYTLLTTDPVLVPALTDANGLQIYGPPGLPREYVLTKTIMFLGNGGSGPMYSSVVQEDFSFWCYGTTPDEAREVWGLLRDQLHRRRHARITVGSQTVQFQYARLQLGPIDQVEPELPWFYAMSTFTIHFVEVPVS